MDIRLLLFTKIERVYSLQLTGSGFEIFLALNASRVLFGKPLEESTLVENNESPYLFLYFASIHDKNHIINSDATVNQREK